MRKLKPEAQNCEYPQVYQYAMLALREAFAKSKEKILVKFHSDIILAGIKAKESEEK